MTKKCSHDEFLKKLELVNKDIKVLTAYVSSAKKISCECLVCQNRWEATPNKLLLGRGCPLCAKVKITKSHNEFTDQLYTISPEIKVVGKYINDCSNIRVMCGNNHSWEATPSRLLQGSKCPLCKIQNETKSHDKFVDDVNIVLKNILILGDYKGRLHRIHVKCLSCSHEWNPLAKSLQDGHGCPVCRKSGFNIAKPAQFYIYKTDMFCGFGITNNPYTRHAEHLREFRRKNINGELIFSIYGDGHKILQLETEIKKKFNTVPQEVKGFKTESIRVEELEVLVEYIKHKL